MSDVKAESPHPKPQIPVKFQRIDAGLGAVADIPRLNPWKKPVGKGISPEMSQLRPSHFQIDVVALNGIFILTQGIFVCFPESSNGFLRRCPVGERLHDILPEENIIIQFGELACHRIMEVGQIRLKAEVSGIDQIRKDLLLFGCKQLVDFLFPDLDARAQAASWNDISTGGNSGSCSRSTAFTSATRALEVNCDRMDSIVFI